MCWLTGCSPLHTVVCSSLMCWLTVYSPLHTAGCSSLMCWLTVNSTCPFHALNVPSAAVTHIPKSQYWCQWKSSPATNKCFAGCHNSTTMARLHWATGKLQITHCWPRPKKRVDYQIENRQSTTSLSHSQWSLLLVSTQGPHFSTFTKIP